MKNGDRFIFQVDRDGEESSSGFVLLPEGFNYVDVQSLGRLLEIAQVFVPGYGEPEVGLYSPDGFIYEKHFEGIDTTLLPDLNVLADWVQLCNGQPAKGTQRASAAILSFCQHLDIEIEPSIACHELAHKNGNPLALSKLAWMRAADNGEFSAWKDVALGISDNLPKPLSQHTQEQLDVDLSKPLKRWRRNYIAALKIGDLELSDLSNLERVMRLFEWMHKDFIAAGPAAMLACIFFAPNSPPKAGLLKGLRSLERERAIEGVRGAAWDITHLSDFLQRVNDHNGSRRRFIFASHETSLLLIAKLLLECSADGIQERRLAHELSRWWPMTHAKEIARGFRDLYRNLDSPTRAANIPPSVDFIDNLTQQGEKRLRDWKPPIDAAP